MDFYIGMALSFSILPGAALAWRRFERLDPNFQPFLWLLWAGLANEIISSSLLLSNNGNTINNNIFLLLQAILLINLFQRLGLFKSNLVYRGLLAVGFTLWAGEWWLSQSRSEFASYFFIGHALLLVLLSISMISRLMIEEPLNLLRNPVFLICLSLIIYFTYAILVEAYLLYGFQHSMVFRFGIFTLHAYVNVATNLIFLFAVLWIPMKRRFLLLQ